MDEDEKRALILRCGKLLAATAWLNLDHEREVIMFLTFLSVEVPGVRAPMSFISQNYDRIIAEARMVRRTMKELTA